ncbi:hypothetical protein [Luteipulveratus flavus]|uniref:PH domain-containing protein n=1 Tax=Luteipulveratus flavus TaxID=3031728 RepID=A0ABT6C2Q5_9MICO|nr:hypothetical protein [Luteipulveratus sp. YIM 133296]MDF8262828.1 hypothetical protein [Luteipulveratus sp. YIM 133296]
MRLHPYFRPKGRNHLALPYLGPYLLGAIGLLAAVSAVGLDLSKAPWLGMVVLVAALVVGLRELQRPRVTPRVGWLLALGVVAACGVLLDVGTRFAPVVLVVAFVWWVWLRGRPPLEVVEVAPGRWEAVADVVPHSTWVDVSADQTTTDAPAPAYEPAPRRLEYALPVPDPARRPSGLPRRSITLVPWKPTGVLWFGLGMLALGFHLIWTVVLTGDSGRGGRAIGAAFALLLLAPGVAMLRTGSSVRLVVDVEGVRTTGSGRWGFRWSELSGLAVVPAAGGGTPALALAVSDPRLVRGRQIATGRVPPFTHVYALPPSRRTDEAAGELVAALATFAPDLLVGPAGATPEQPYPHRAPDPVRPVSAPPEGAPPVGADVRVPVPAPHLRPSGVRRRRVATGRLWAALAIGTVSACVLVLGGALLLASVTGRGVDQVWPRLLAGGFGVLFLLFAVAGLSTVLLDLTRRIEVDGVGMRLTGISGWRFTWDEVAAVAVVVSQDRARSNAPVGIAVAAPSHEQRGSMTYETWEELPPFTHLCPVRGGRDGDVLRTELATALGAVVPDLYVGELPAPVAQPSH